MFTAYLLSYQLFTIQVLGLPQESVGAILAVSILVLATGNWLSGVLAARFRLPRVCGVGVSVTSTGLLIMATAPGAVVWMLGLVLFQLGLGIDLVAFGSWMHDLIPSGHRAAWLSAISSTQIAFGILGTLSAGFLIEAYGFRIVWIGVALLSALTLLPQLALAKTHEPIPAVRPDDVGGSIAPGSSTPPEKGADGQ